MSEKLEQTMKKIHIYLANCKESAYSSEELIVSKKRIFSLLEDLNYAVYEVMEEYEATVAARDRGLAMVERQAADIKEDAMHRAEEVYASSLLYTQEAIAEMQNALEYTFEKTKREYEMLMQGYQEKIMYLEQDSQEIVSQLSAMADAKTYLHIVEDINAKRKAMTDAERAEEDAAANSRKLGNAADSGAEEVPQDEFESKMSAQIVVEVHETPKIPEGFGKGKRKKKGKQAPDESGQVTMQELDAEYFAFQEEQQQALAEQMAEESAAAEETGDFFRDAIRKLTAGNKKAKEKQEK